MFFGWHQFIQCLKKYNTPHLWLIYQSENRIIALFFLMLTLRANTTLALWQLCKDSHKRWEMALPSLRRLIWTPASRPSKQMLWNEAKCRTSFPCLLCGCDSVLSPHTPHWEQIEPGHSMGLWTWRQRIRSWSQLPKCRYLVLFQLLKGSKTTSYV